MWMSVMAICRKESRALPHTTTIVLGILTAASAVRVMRVTCAARRHMFQLDGQRRFARQLWMLERDARVTMNARTELVPVSQPRAERQRHAADRATIRVMAATTTVLECRRVLNAGWTVTVPTTIARATGME